MSDRDLEAVRSLFAGQRGAVLCTAHAGLDGWPYGSLVPYAMTARGDLVVFLSDIAEHTRNLRRDPRATVFVQDPAAAAEPQAGARHAMLVRARCPDGAERETVEACYFARFPAAAAQRQAHGFAAWLLECERIRWIAGFGAMGWIDRATWTGTPDPLAPHAHGIVVHLCEDHADALAELAAHAAGRKVASARAVGLDRGGLELEVLFADGGSPRPVRVPFPAVASTPEEVRAVVIAMLRKVRADRE